MQQILPPSLDPSILHGLVGKITAGSKCSIEECKERAEGVLAVAAVLGCRRFATAADISSGNERMNFAFTATLFNRHIAIHLPSEDEMREMIAKTTESTKQVQMLHEEVQALKEELKRSKRLQLESTDDLQSKLLHARKEAQEELDALRASLHDVRCNSETTQLHLVSNCRQTIAREFEVKLSQVAKAMEHHHLSEIKKLSHGFGVERAELMESIDAIRMSLHATNNTAQTQIRSKSVISRNAGTIGTSNGSSSMCSEGLAELGKDVLKLLGQKKTLESTAHSLQSKLDRHDRLDNVMSEKIQEYAELMMSSRPAPRKKNFFSGYPKLSPRS